MPTIVTNNRLAPAQSPERKTLADKVWQEAAMIARSRIDEARDSFIAHAEQPDNQQIADLAYALQTHEINQPETEDWTTSQMTANRISQLVLSLPTAARAQDVLNRSRSTLGKTELTNNIAILSQFNQNLAGALTYMPTSMVGNFTDKFLDKTQHGVLGLPGFNERSFRSIVDGISREVALWRALDTHLPDDLTVRGATVEEDLSGTDLIVTDTSNHSLLLDTKASSSFKALLTKRLEAGHISVHVYEQSIAQNYWQNTHKGVTRYIVNADALGDISNFLYKSPEAAASFIEDLFNRDKHDARLQKLAETAINI